MGSARLCDELGDPLRVAAAAAAAVMQASANAAPAGASSFGAGELQHAVRAEFVDERGPLGVVELEFGELVENRLGELGAVEVDQRQDGAEIVLGSVRGSSSAARTAGLVSRRELLRLRVGEPASAGGRGGVAARARRPRTRATSAIERAADSVNRSCHGAESHVASDSRR